MKLFTSARARSSSKLINSNIYWETEVVSDIPTIVQSLQELPNITTLNGLEYYKDNFWITYDSISPANTSYVAKYNPDNNTVTNIPAYPAINAGNQRYKALKNFDGYLYILRDNNSPYIFATNDDGWTNNYPLYDSHVRNFVDIFDNKLYVGRSVGSNAGDGWFNIQPNLSGQSTHSINTRCNSGSGTTILPFKGKFYYGAGSVDRILTSDTLFSSLSVINPNIPSFGSCNLGATHAASYLMADEDDLIAYWTGNYFANPQENRNYSVFNGTAWTAKTLPANTFFAMHSPQQTENFKNNALWTLTFNTTTKELAVYAWDKTNKEFIYNNTIHTFTGATHVACGVTKRVNDSIHFSAAVSYGTTYTKAFFIKMT